MLIRVIDFETTGLPDNEKSRICEIGRTDLIRDDGGEWRVARTWSFLCNPGCPIPPEVRAIHHISDADVRGKPSPEGFLAELSEDAPNAFAAHNAKFEQHFFPDTPTPWICTYKVALRLWPDAPSHSNQALRYWLGMELGSEAMPPHRAGPDAFVTAHLLIRELNQGGATFEDMLRWSAGPPLLPRVNFGKHFGAKWQDVPSDYLDWIVNKSDMDSDIKANARHHLKSRRAPTAQEAP